jgi:6-phosphogluconate dehydrogenase
MYTLYSEDYIQTMYLTEIPSAQCVSLQRDVFGRHGFERLDKEKTGSTVSAF